MAKGIIAAGHELTVAAAEQVLANGGNAFDAAIAAFYAACLAEPVLASPGGGGFLLAKPAAHEAVLYDFFVETPLAEKRQPVDFTPVMANFGTALQEFHIGLGSIAVPGAVRGIFDVHRDLSSMPMRELVSPALGYAREGIRMNAFQAFILDIISPILLHKVESRDYFAGSDNNSGLLTTDDLFYPDKLACTLETLAIEGDDLFYRGEIASAIVDACKAGGGLLSQQDLAGYRCEKRTPLSFRYRDCQIVSNPAPSSGGILIAFALKLLEQVDVTACPPQSIDCIHQLVQAMDLTQQARLSHGSERPIADLLDRDLLDQYRQQIEHRAQAPRGTTHISIIDRQGNMAGMSLSNGEGCGYMLADTGIMLNNMLGEEDLNPHGFFNWRGGQRMTSMMAPSLMLFDDGRHVVTGSGGSNRIRTALMQVMINLIDHGMPIDEAVSAPRVHYENQSLNIEGLFDDEVLSQLHEHYPQCQSWPARNLYFGGTHSVMQHDGSFSGAGDQRRGGVCKQVDQA